ncbi:MAG: DNA adenine methylase [Waterburya sp.]
MARPFVKWCGGKTQSIKDLETFLPKSFNRYIEPFVGGGALFFHIKSKELCQEYLLNDLNSNLINAYRVVRDSVEELIENLRQHQNDEEYYYRLRSVERTTHYESLSSIEKASRFIFLNKTCFNGLYRCNSKGFFNTPYGNYKNFKIDCEGLKRCSIALQKVRLTCESYIELEAHLTKGDFIYFDPPYLPLNPTSRFTEYTDKGFDYTDHLDLKEMCDRLSDKKIPWMLSNSDCELSRELYKNYRIVSIESRRSINCKGGKRQKINEILVVNTYENT